MGSERPSRETFISTCGPLRSKAAASARACRGIADSKSAAAKPANHQFFSLKTLKAKNTPASLSGLGALLFDFRKMHRATDYSASEMSAQKSLSAVAKKALVLNSSVRSNP